MVGRDLRLGASGDEAQRDRAVDVRLDRGHPPAQAHIRERGRDRLRELLVAAGDVVALVGGAEDREVAGTRLVAEQVDEVQRGLDRRLGAVLLVVRHVEEHPEG